MTKKATPHELVSLSFFSGCGGLDLGLEQAGIQQRLACDFDKYCRLSLSKNRPDLPVIDDLLNYSSGEIRKLAGLKRGQRPTLMVGGPPCQAFSTAGRRQGFKDARGNVFLRYVELIEELEPEYAVIENVRGLLSASLSHRPHNERAANYLPSLDETPGGALAYILNWLSKIGYGVRFNLYNSANFGVPQVRERVILIAARDGSQVPFLRPTHSNDSRFGLPAWRTFASAVEGLHEAEMKGVKFPEKRLKYYRMLEAGQYWKHLPSEELKKEALGKSYFSGGGKTGFFRRISWDKPSPTLVTHPAMPATDLAHPAENRPLSIQEYKRIQMFPDSWKIEGKLTDQYKQVGNAVPVGLGYAVGQAIVNHINGTKYAEKFCDFPYSRYKGTDDVSWLADFNRRLSRGDGLIQKRSEQLQLDI